MHDDLVLDPAGLVAYRRAGYSLICWSTDLGAPWSERLARARALELRLYMIVFDSSLCRAFAVDPDGTIVAGTFDGYQLASFSFDPRKTAETLSRREATLAKVSSGSPPSLKRRSHRVNQTDLARGFEFRSGNKLVSLAAAIIAVLAALGTLFSHHRSIAALSAKNQAILTQARATDTYNAYEAKQIRYNIYQR